MCFKRSSHQDGRSPTSAIAGALAHRLQMRGGTQLSLFCPLPPRHLVTCPRACGPSEAFLSVRGRPRRWRELSSPRAPRAAGTRPPGVLSLPEPPSVSSSTSIVSHSLFLGESYNDLSFPGAGVETLNKVTRFSHKSTILLFKKYHLC